MTVAELGRQIENFLEEENASCLETAFSPGAEGKWPAAGEKPRKPSSEETENSFLFPG